MGYDAIGFGRNDLRLPAGELVWVVDRFKPLQVGQCGDFWAFTAACEGRADAGEASPSWISSN